MKRLGLFVVVLALVAAACSSDDSGSTTSEGAGSESVTSASVVTSAAPSTTTTTTTTEPPPEVAEVPAGVIWERINGEGAPPVGKMELVTPLDDGWLVVGRHIAEDRSLYNIIWLGSADGATWESHEVPDDVAEIDFSDIAVDGDVIVAVGAVESDCRMRLDFGGDCATTEAAAAVSVDGGRTWSRAAHDGTFVGGSRGVGSSLEDVDRNPAGGFVAIGQEQTSSGYWPGYVWASDDGTSWSRVSEIQGDWSIRPQELGTVGDRLVIHATELVCSSVAYAEYGWGLGNWHGSQSRVLWSDDGVNWIEDDIVGEGLIVAYDDSPSCADFESVEGTSGSFTVHNGRALFTAGESSWVADGAGSWESIPYTDYLDRIGFVDDHWFKLWFESTMVRLEVNLETSRDLSSWVEHRSYARPVASLSSSATLEEARMGGWAAGDSMIVAAGADVSSGERLSVFLVSTATEVPKDPPTCEPGPGVDCSSVDLSKYDLAGVDMTGINLRFAVLSDADLSGADLTGADLTGARLSRTNLSNAILHDAVLTGATGFDPILDGADFTNAVAVALGFEPLPTATWDGADLSDLSAYPADPVTFVLDNTNLTQATINGEMPGSSFSGATMVDASISGDLTNADFTGADLTSVYFGFQTNLTGARFADAVLDETSFYGADFCPDGEAPRRSGSCDGQFIDR